MRTQRPTMSDVAARAGVSRTLVSFILAGKPGAGEQTRDRVLRAADELGYRPDSAARLLARRRSRTLGVLLDVQQPFQSDLVSAIYPVAEAAGYEVLLSATARGRDEDKAIEALLSHRCEGLVLLGPACEPTYLMSLADRAVVVVVGRPVAPTASTACTPPTRKVSGSPSTTSSSWGIAGSSMWTVAPIPGRLSVAGPTRRSCGATAWANRSVSCPARIPSRPASPPPELLLGEPGPLPTAGSPATARRSG